MTTTLGPRVVVAATHSGAGKTTVATGILAALARRGRRVASAKVGPDFIDPGYHSLATGRPARNLDAWICGEDAMRPLAARAAVGADLLVVEGVMGLFDGVSDPEAMRSVASGRDHDVHESDAVPIASTAAVAGAIGAPIVLVVDASSMSDSVAALVHGFHTYSSHAAVSGVILNRVGSDTHREALVRALAPTGVPVIGALHRDDALVWRDRHLGLVPVVENTAEVLRSIRRLADAIQASVDLDAIEALARTARPIRTETPAPAHPQTDGSAGDRPNRPRVRVALASGPAFSFMYPDNVERLEEAGAEIVPFDPVNDPHLPDRVNGLVAGGGFPETFVHALSTNRPLLDDVRKNAKAGLVVWAECGGLLWLARSLDGHSLCGVVEAEGVMTKKLTLGYRAARVRIANPLARAGAVLRGHEFHYSTLRPPGESLDLAGREGITTSGYCGQSMIASYLHLHLGADPGPAERFVARAAGAMPRAPRERTRADRT